MNTLNVKPRTIFCHDNLQVLEGINTGCIDLIYLDPPFNKKKVFTASIGSSAEGATFSDIFREEDIKDEWIKNIEYENPDLYSYLCGVKSFSNQYNYCYLVYMAIRIIECHRILKDTGSIYLHCDPTISHYLKIVLDCILGENNFRNEIVWCYRGGGVSKKDFAKKHDILFRYSKMKNYVFNTDSARIPYSEHVTNSNPSRYDKSYRKNKTYAGYKPNEKGKHPEDWWALQPIMPSSKERTGYPTQKPLALLERIIKASSNEGDIVLDPFCGCATTCVAAERWGRKWIGVDVSHKAYELVNERLEKMYSEQSDHLAIAPLLKSGKYDIKANYTTTPPKRSKDAQQEQGYLYIIANSNWKGIFKVGIAKDPQRRLNSYQTSDPYRAYILVYTFKTPYFREIEKAIHEQFKAAHEWLESDVKTIKSAIKDIENKLRS